jgi:Zinc-binding loop region of homing endonuclease
MIFGDNRLPKRFWDKVQPEPNTGCWLWTGSANQNGRPQFWGDGTNHRPYKIATELERGPCPDGKECSHLCDQKLCVNPDHVIYETKQENNFRRRTRPEYLQLSPKEYDKATTRDRVRAWRIRKKEASCD